MEKSLYKLIETVQHGQIIGNDCTVCSLQYDSRKVSAGAVFFALDGLHTDGTDYIPQAIQNGAVAVVHAKPLTNIEKGICYIQVKNTRTAMAEIADKFYDSPSQKLSVIGVTGTEGKSSTVSFIWQLLNELNYPCGYFSTVSFAYGDRKNEKKNPEHQTTPESITVQKHLYEMLQNGCKYAVVEASSHGLSKRTERLHKVSFDAAVFMNVTEEHLEFHKTFENYRSDKANLFRKLDEPGEHSNRFGVVNLDDPSADYFVKATKKQCLGFTVDKATAESSLACSMSTVLYADNMAETAGGLEFGLHVLHAGSVAQQLHLKVPLAGLFNVKNVMAAMLAVSQITETPISKVAEKLPALTPITGRMFSVREGQNFNVLIDYAHTPSSFETIMPSLSEAAHRAGKKLIALFGSGGERDITKRPEQGRIADKYCDIIVLADEDPRGEDSFELLNMIAAGITHKEPDKSLFLIPNRHAAIRKAFSLCSAGDTVLLLGKSHENSIIYRDHADPYDEETAAREALREMR